MDGQIFLGWLKINISFFIAAFIVSLLLAFLFPDTMLGFVRGWGAYSRTAGPIVLEQTSKGDLFVNILAKNSFNTILYFIASLFFLAPLIAAMIGIFYSLGLMSAADHFMKGEIWYPLWSSPVLISIEVSFILLTITFASALGAEIFGVKPERGEIMDFWRENWKRLSPEQKRDWRVVLKENKKEIILFTVILFALILFVGNYSGMLIGLLIAILCFLSRKITAEYAEVRRVFSLLRVPLRPPRLNSLFGSGMSRVR